MKGCEFSSAFSANAFVNPGVKFTPEPGSDEHANHFGNFFENIRKGSQATIEDPIFGFRAAAPVLACNESYFQKKAISWDPVNMRKL